MMQPPVMTPGGPMQAAPPPPMLHDCVVQRSKTNAFAKIMPVPPEEWGIERNARSLADCNYCFHRPPMTEGRAIAQGYDKKQIKALPTYWGMTNTEEMQRDTVNEHTAGVADVNTAARPIDLVEHYIRMDYDGKGELKLYKVTTGGSQGEILRKTTTDDDGKTTTAEDIEEFDMMPFAAMTPVIMTHRFFGRSIADLVMDIMRIKTALMRGMLDNIYLALNPRVEVAQDHANGDTLDDLLVSRPGGIVRTKTPGGIQWQEVPNVTAGVFPALEYMDSTREWRTGVTRQGQGIDSHALQNQSATASAQVYSMSQARIKLIARIFAETGIKDLFVLLHGMIRKHGSEQAQTVKLRNTWTQVNPRDWKTRNDLTVHVGLGDGSKTEQIAHVTTVIGMQKEALMGGPASASLVNAQGLYNSAKQLVKLVGLKDATKYFVDPTTAPPAPPPPPDPKVQAIQMQMQLEEAKAQKDAELEQAKTASQLTIEREKHNAAMELAAFNARIKLEQHGMDMKLQSQKMAHADNAEAAKQSADKTTASEHATGIVDAMHQGLAVLGDHLTKLHQAHADAVMGELKKVSAPKRRVIVRGADGKATHADEIPMQ